MGGAGGGVGGEGDATICYEDIEDKKKKVGV